MHEQSVERPYYLIVMYCEANEHVYICDFGFDIQLRLLFAIGFSPGFLFIPVKNLCIVPRFRKHHLLVLGTAVTITCIKYYGMFILCLYAMELKCLYANTSYSITEIFTCLNMPRYVIEEHLQ
jgi:hypothetical protein